MLNYVLNNKQALQKTSCALGHSESEAVACEQNDLKMRRACDKSKGLDNGFNTSFRNRLVQYAKAQTHAGLRIRLTR